VGAGRIRSTAPSARRTFRLSEDEIEEIETAIP
jgi:hypothetical protein